MSLQNTPDVIGEGTYGCVHYPSLKCKSNKTNINYSNKVSKLTTTSEAKSELNEYNIISKIDKEEQYYIGKPIICSFDNKLQSNINAMAKCKNRHIKHARMNSLSLLVMENGGDNLETFTEKMQNLDIVNTNIRTVELFLLELHSVFMGLKIFIDNKIVHHDLKPQNLVYSLNTNKIKFIDFGFMTTTEKIKSQCKKSNYSLSVNHWSFPFELYYYNKKKYINYCKQNKTVFVNDLINGFSMNSTNRDIINMVKSTKTLFSYIIPKRDYDVHSKNYINELQETLLNSYIENKYDDFLKDSVNTIDIYGTGIACMYFLNLAGKFITPNILKNELYTLFYQMVRPDFYKRIKIDDLINQYETILNKHNLVLKYNKQFVNHTVVNDNERNKSIRRRVNSIKKKSIKINKKERKQNSQNPLMLKECPPEKELNPITNRCNNKCKPNYIRNELFKCVKTRKQNLQNIPLLKECPPEKELNPITNRCNNKCKPNYIRNELFKCVRNIK